MILAIIALIAGLALLVWSADRFVEGAAALARHLGMKPLLIGIIIIGFGTSAPEMLVSALSALEGSPGIALGNAYGSNIANIALILGVTALISPILVHSSVLRKEVPILVAIIILSFILIMDNGLSRIDSLVLVAAFFLLMGWTVYEAKRNPADPLTQEMEKEATLAVLPIGWSVFWLITGLVLLIVSSHSCLGRGCYRPYFRSKRRDNRLDHRCCWNILPELPRRCRRMREHDMALGNVLGSNMFNTLAVVGISGLIKPYAVDADILTRDMPVMLVLTLSFLSDTASGGDRAGSTGWKALFCWFCMEDTLPGLSGRLSVRQGNVRRGASTPAGRAPLPAVQK